MKRFFFGILVTLGSLTLLSIVAGTGLFIWAKNIESGSKLPEQFVLEVDLRPTMPLANLPTPLSLLDEPSLALDDFILKLKAAETDPRVTGLLVRIAETNHGMARAQEIRRAISRFGSTGKSTAAWADSFGELTPGNEGYYIAAATERLAMQPGGYLGLTGVAFELPFFRGLFEKIGVEPVVFRRSSYKTALDSFTHDGLSTANAEMLESISLEVFSQLVSGIAENRELTVSAVEDAIDQAPMAAETALRSGLVDQLTYWSEFRDSLIADQREGTSFVDLADYDRQFGEGGDDESASIGIVSLEGNIVRGNGGFRDGIAADTVSNTLRNARDSDVDAIIIRLDSGGGSAVASDTIAFEIQQLANSNKPVIISMVNAAASGGYWIAVEGSQLLALPGTFTGSIGVIAGKPLFTELLQKLDIEVDGASHGRFSQLWSVAKQLEPFEATKIDDTVGEVYDRFKSHVSLNRELSIQQVEELAQGRVWLGIQAVDLTLIDQLGGLDEAIAHAMDHLGKDQDLPIRIERFPKEQDWADILTDFAELPFNIGVAWLSELWPKDPGMLTGHPPISIR